MALVDGFDVTYMHRGSWKVRRTLNGREIDVIPVAWLEDWQIRRGHKGTLSVWFKDQSEVDAHLSNQQPFAVAVAVKNNDGSASSSGIRAIFEVAPLRASSTQKGIRCSVTRRVTASEQA